MTVYYSENVFTRFLFNLLDDSEKKNIVFLPSSLLSKKLNEDLHSIALIPALEIITNKDLFVSRSTGISFEGLLSNSFIYFGQNQKNVTDVKLAGDISSMEVILCKILFKELYNSDIEISVHTGISENIKGTHLIAGDGNFRNAKYENGINITDQIIEMISAPFVNYVLASSDENALKSYSSKIIEIITDLNYEDNEVFNDYDPRVSEFLRENFNKIVYKLDEQDIAGIVELLRLTYYHGLIEDIIDVKFI